MTKSSLGISMVVGVVSIVVMAVPPLDGEPANSAHSAGDRGCLDSGLGSLGPTLGPDVEWSERGAEVAAEIGEPIVTVLVLLHQAGTGQVTYAVVEDAGREAVATREQRAGPDRATAKLPEDTERPPVA
jgi:hypothetical protein